MSCATLMAVGQQIAPSAGQSVSAPDKASAIEAPFANTGVPAGAAAGIPLGDGPNAYTSAFGSRTAVWYDPTFDFISFVHRSNFSANGDAGSGSIRYDLSADAGATWTNNLGPVYNGGDARYPSGAIVYPAGTTVATDAYFAWAGPTLDGSNGAWGGFGSALVGLDNPADTSDWRNVETSAPLSGVYNLINTGFFFSPATGVIHSTDQNVNLVDPTGDYTDQIQYRRGVISNGQINWTSTLLSAPTGINNADSSKVIADERIAFGPNGLTGYITWLGATIDTADAPYGTYNIHYMKTVDGGLTWGTPGMINVTDLQGAQNGLTFGGQTGPFALSTAFEHDVAVDMNGNAHISVGICAASATAFSISTGPGFFGVFDVRTEDGGTSWKADLIALPMTFRGTFGDPNGTTLSEDNRPQTASSADGSHIFVVYTDTDSNLSPDNNFPDVYTRGLNVNTGYWNPLSNETVGTNDDGLVRFANVSHYAIDNGNGDYTIPVTYTILLGANDDVGSPVAFEYVAAGTDMAFSTEEFSKAELIGKVYPNPSADFTRIALDLPSNELVMVEVLNNLGQAVSTVNYGVQTAGVSNLDLDVSALPSGLYIVRVTAGNLTDAQTLIVE